MKNKSIVWLYKIASWLCWKAPTRLTYTFATIMGELYYWTFRAHSRNADANMRIVLGEPEINRRVRLVARRSFRNYAKYMADFLRQSHLTPPQIVASCDGVGWNHIADIKKGDPSKDRGVIVISPHFGNMDGAAVISGGYGYRVGAVARDFEPPELNALIQGARQTQGVDVFSLKDSAKRILTLLKNKGMIVLVADAPLHGSDGVLVEFFGKPIVMAAGPATLAYHTGAALMLGYVVRQPGDQKFYGCWEAPMQYELTGNREQDLQIITQTVATHIEKLIRRHPDQWYMFRSLFLSEEEATAYREAHQKTERRNRPAKNKVVS